MPFEVILGGIITVVTSVVAAGARGVWRWGREVEAAEARAIRAEAGWAAQTDVSREQVSATNRLANVLEKEREDRSRQRAGDA